MDIRREELSRFAPGQTLGLIFELLRAFTGIGTLFASLRGRAIFSRVK